MGKLCCNHEQLRRGHMHAHAMSCEAYARVRVSFLILLWSMDGCQVVGVWQRSRGPGTLEVPTSMGSWTLLLSLPALYLSVQHVLWVCVLTQRCGLCTSWEGKVIEINASLPGSCKIASRVEGVCQCPAQRSVPLAYRHGTIHALCLTVVILSTWVMNPLIWTSSTTKAILGVLG